MEYFWFAFLLLLFFYWVFSEQKAERKRLVNLKIHAAEIIYKHQGELTTKRRQLTIQMGYGLVDDSKWKKEINFFIENLILPGIIKIKIKPTDFDQMRTMIYKATASYEKSSAVFSPAISPTDYEDLVASRLREFGWSARTTSATGDQGIDIIAEKDGLKLVVQCKLYSSPVGNKAVQEIIAGKTFEQADAAAVISNATYTPSARQLASSAGVMLLHHDEISSIDLA